MRNVATTALEVAGLLAVCVGTFLVWTPAGLIVSGAIATAVGYLLAGEQQ